MYSPITEAVYRLERLGLKVRNHYRSICLISLQNFDGKVLGLTIDGAKSNRLVATLLNPNAKNSSELTYKVPNPYTDED